MLALDSNSLGVLTDDLSSNLSFDKAIQFQKGSRWFNDCDYKDF